MSAPNVRNAFGSVMRPGTVSPLSVGTPVTAAPDAASSGSGRRARAASAVTDYVAEFIDVCASAIDVAYGRDPSKVDVAPGVAVPAPLPMLLAYLLYLASTAPDHDGERVADWFAHVDRPTWTRLGFTQAPSLLHVELAFSLMARREHQAPELHSLIALVEFLAGAELLYGLRS